MQASNQAGKQYFKKGCVEGGGGSGYVLSLSCAQVLGPVVEQGRVDSKGGRE